MNDYLDDMGIEAMEAKQTRYGQGLLCLSPPSPGQKSKLGPVILRIR